ncbi:MAG: aldehyde ferredoxin oxidoreductase family protein [Proteobacteria bacterium]|nr:aldehyde ferredoxin oxidoreductase family protein [Pseudomonadota bacterium]
MGKGYMGKVLFVDLSKGELKEETIPDEVYQKYIGGMGLAAYLLYNKIPANADPLGPDNIIGFLPGLLTGTGSFFTGRWMVAAKSPLTGSWGDANCGGSLSPAIKRCGYDGIFFSGISKKPVYLYIDHHTKELRDASEYWGKDAVEAEEMLIAASGSKKTRVACIGEAGEKLSLISGVSTDKGRMAGRSGIGAVMGSKKLKAIVLNGKKRIQVHDKAEMKHLSKLANKFVKFQVPLPNLMPGMAGILMRALPNAMAQDGMLYKMMLRKWGTVSMNQLSPEMGDSPIKNWMGSSKDWGFSKSYSTHPGKILKREKVKYHCYSCPLGCGGICSMKGKYKETHKPEYETVLALGGLCMNKDADSIFYLNEILNRAGMDTISAGAAAAFAIECYENGILTKKDTDGLELKWGNSKAITQLIEKMIKREGIGDLLADGVKKAAEKIGKGAEQYAIHAGGQELPMHDARNDPGFALHYTAEPTPGRHTLGAGLYYEMFQLWKVAKKLPKVLPLYMKGAKYKTDNEKAVMGATNSKFMSVVNSAGGCKFGMFIGAKRVRLFDWLNAATGWNKTPEEYLAMGENIQTIKQSFNVKHGIEPKNITVSDRVLGKPFQTEGANKGRTVDLEPVRSAYWSEFGWNPETGKPTPERMAEFTNP